MAAEQDWRDRSAKRRLSRRRRRARLWFGVVSAVMIASASAAFIVPMLVTP